MQIVWLVLDLFAVATPHEAVVPSAMLQPEHMPNLMQHRFHGTVQQLCATPFICTFTPFWSVANETENAHT
jgi:hypothetical protein